MNIQKRSVVMAALSASVALLLSGCGAGIGSTAPSSITLGRIAGKVHGVPNPVTGATVTLYETQVGSTTGPGSGPSGYGDTAPKQLGTATTGSQGEFSFTAGYTCDTSPMQYAYIVVTGGNSGAGVNNNLVLMDALGACSNLATTAAQNATQVFVSEATTVAAAYALSNFTTVTGAAGAQVVNVSSTLTNDATSPSCTNSGGVLSSCTAGGLGHAFTTAMNLANGVTFNFTGTNFPTGLFNTSVASYPGSVIPQAMLNTVASALQNCVNSPGGAVTSGASDGSTCGNLFQSTTPAGGAAPTDTMTAMINLARYPSNPAATASSGGIYSQIGAFQYYTPQLAAAPADYSLGIYYPGVYTTIVGSTPTTVNEFPYAYSLALDIADDIYIAAADNNTVSTYGATPATGNITTTGLAAITQGASGPAPLYPYTTASSSTLLNPGSVAVDSQGNVFMTNAAPTPNNAILKFSGSAGTLTTTYSPTFGGSSAIINLPGSMAVDLKNQLWVSTQNPITASGGTTYTSALYQVPVTGTGSAVTTNSTNYMKLTNNQQGNLNGVAIDARQNVWSCSNGSSMGTAAATSPKVYAFPNSGGIAGTTQYLAAAGTPSGPLGGNPNGGPAIDAAGNVYCPNRKNILLGVPTSTTAPIASNPSVSVQSVVAPDLTAGAQMDGNGNYVTVARGIGKAFIFPIVAPAAGSSTFAGTAANVQPCLPLFSSTNGAYYCSDNTTGFPTGSYTMLNNASSAQIDSTGSLWVAVGSTGTNGTGTSGLVQVIGPIAPTWPQLSYSKNGVKP